MGLIFFFVFAALMLTGQQEELGVVHEYPDGLNWIGDPDPEDDDDDSHG